MALIICYVIACVQILGAAYNLWGFDPRILLNFSIDRNSLFIAMFLVMQILGIVGGLLMFTMARLGLLFSIFHHLLLMPMLLFTSSRFVLLTDDLINASLFYVSKPTGSSVAFYWSLGWNSVFEQVTKGVPRGSFFIGINLFALVCALLLWGIVRQMGPSHDEDEEEEYEDEEELRAREMEMLRRQQQARRRPPEPAPERRPPPEYPDYDYPQYPQQQRMPPQQRPQQPPQQHSRPQQRLHPQPGVRMPPRVPPRDS
jgi:hypothetical protein